MNEQQSQEARESTEGVRVDAAPSMEDVIERIENEVGMGHRAWDMVKPEDLIHAVLKHASGVTGTPNDQQEQPR